MKPVHYFTSLLLFFALQQGAAQNFYIEKWREVEQFELQDKIEDAKKVVEKIDRYARRKKDKDQYIKVFLFKSKYQLVNKEEAQYKIIAELDGMIEKAKFPNKNIYHAIMARLLDDYAQSNQWRIINRTPLDTYDNDFTTWDATKFYSEISMHYQLSLNNPEKLVKVPLSDYRAILGALPPSRVLRPTMLDLLSHQALDFYKSSYFSLTKPKEEFYITDKIAFLNAADIKKLGRPAGDTIFSKFDVLQLYADLELIHKSNNNDAPFIHVYVDRLNYTKAQLNSIQYEDYVLRLEDVISDNQKNAAVTYAMFHLASYYYNLSNIENDESRANRKKAIEIAQSAISLFPQSYGGVKSTNLINQIYSPTVSVQVETNLMPDRPHRGVISYRNAAQVSIHYLKVAQDFSFEPYHKKDSLTSDVFHKAIRNQKLQTTIAVELLQGDDTFNHTYEYVAPALEKGRYLVFAQNTGDLSQPLATTFISISNITLLTSKERENLLVFHTKDRTNGKSLRGVQIDVTLNNDDDRSLEPLITDSRGRARLELLQSHRNNYDITAHINGDTLKTNKYEYYRGYRDKKKNDRTGKAFVYLDRAIYRPGQKVYFKAIALSNKVEKTQVMTDLDLQVIVRDANSQIIKTIDVETNDFGSVHGSFDLTVEALLGRFSLQVQRRANKRISGIDRWVNTSISFQVEEYKRPRFEVEFKEVTQTFQLNDSVKVTGFARAFLGSNVTGANVTYKVYQSISKPFYRDSFTGNDKVVDQGTTKTNEKGAFEIVFFATKDPNTEANSKPIYNYRIEAEVTDVNGETREAQTSVRIGESTIQVVLDVANLLSAESNEIKIAAQNLNGQLVPAKLIFELRKKQDAQHLIIASSLPKADFHQIDDKLYRNRFPFAELRETEKEQDWKKNPIIFRKEITTDSLTTVEVPITKEWRNGSYYFYVRAVEPVQSFENEDDVVESKTERNIWANKDLPLEPSIIDAKTNIVDNEVVVELFTSMNEVYATIVVWDDDKMIKEEEVFLKKGKTQFFYPLKKVKGDKVYARFMVQKENTFVSEGDEVDLPIDEEQVYAISTSTFRSKLEPGIEEKWSFTIKDQNELAMNAEVLASMYDKSLDDFQSSYWSAPYFYNYKDTYSPSFPSALTSSSVRNFSLNFKSKPEIYYRLEYDQLRFFGLNLNDFSNGYRRYKTRLSQKYVDLTPRNGYVVGKVTDTSGEPILGAIILIKGTSIATTTDFDGNYSIAAATGDVLEYSFAGYDSKEIRVKKQSVINVLMETSLDAVVIIGYRTTGGYNYSSREPMAVVSEEMDAGIEMIKDDKSAYRDADRPNASLVQTLQGQVEGLNIQSVNNQQDSLSISNEQLDKVVARKNLQETAFFLPELRTDQEGNLKFSFTSPEALTQWKLRLLAHDKKGKTAKLEQLVVTQKELSIIPNAPRFLRETDTIRFSTKIANLSEAAMDGTARLQLFDAVTMNAIDAELGNVNNTRDFTIDKGGNTSVNWTFRIPLGTQAVTYRVVAAAGNFSDGEENTLPVLSNRMLVSESRALWVRAGETQTAVMKNLLESDSGTMAHHQMVFEYTSNPSWYAIKSLPYLMEYDHECAEQTFSRYYANSMAHHILTSNPKVKTVFDSWAQNGSNVSPLEQNEELKTVMLSHTPWLRDAQSEAQKQQRLATLFDLANTANQKKKTLAKLERLQMNSGGFPWFKGGKMNEYITRHIAAGLGHMKQLGVKNDDTPQTDRIYENAIDALDAEWKKRFKNYLKNHKSLEEYNYGNAYWHYQYARSFDISKSGEDYKMLQEAVDYAFAKAEKEYSTQPLYTKLLMAITLQRNGKSKLASSIMDGLKQTAVKSDENGMYWKENQNSWYWYSSDIETQALAIEAFQEVSKDLKSVEELKIWLLKNKRTNQWKSTKATADATYALLLQGGKWLDVQENNKITWGNKPIPEEKMKEVEKEAGTGYFKITMTAPEVQKELATVTVKNKSDVTGYGALYWQYFEDLDQIVSDQDQPLSIQKKLFKKIMTDSGEKLQEITAEQPLKIGDLITVRLIIKTSADMDFVHLKDMRASGFEPVDVISQYKWQDGLGYYKSTKDVATHFFFDHMNKGTYVFEYDVRANNAGQFSNGITQLECMYAPEFSSHSEGMRVRIEE